MSNELYLHCRRCIATKQADNIAVVARPGRYEVVCESHDPPMAVHTIKADTSELLGRGCSECPEH